MNSEQDVSCIMVVFHCLQIWINCCDEMKDHLGHSGIISNIVLLHLKLIQALPVLDDVRNMLDFICSALENKREGIKWMEGGGEERIHCVQGVN